MKVAIKATHLVPGGGLMHFNRITEWFGKLAPETQFIVLGRDGQQQMFEIVPNNFEYHYYRQPARNLAVRIYWEKFKLPGIVDQIKPDLLFEPGNYGTSGVSCPKISLLHNIAPFSREYIRSGSLHQKLRLKLLRAATINSMRTSQGVIFLAEHYREFFSKYLNYAQTKTAVVYHAGQETEYDLDPAQVLRELGIEGDYLLNVSHVYRYKKVKEMVQAYLKALESNPNLPPLYIAGELFTKDYVREIENLILQAGAPNRIIFLGSVDQARLQILYRHCVALLFPSVLETCSVILIEAMGNGCAIACSNKSVMPEVTGRGAFYFDPDNIEEFARAIKSVVEDKNLRQRLREHSRNRAEFFSWEKSSRQTLAFFDEVLGMERKPIESTPVMETVGV